MVLEFWVKKVRDLGHWRQYCKNHFCTYIREKWINLHQTNTKMTTYYGVLFTSENVSFLWYLSVENLFHKSLKNRVLLFNFAFRTNSAPGVQKLDIEIVAKNFLLEGAKVFYRGCNREWPFGQFPFVDIWVINLLVTCLCACDAGSAQVHSDQWLWLRQFAENTKHCTEVFECRWEWIWRRSGKHCVTRRLQLLCNDNYRCIKVLCVV